MRKIIFTTESGADLPPELAKRYNIYTVPMHVIMDGVDYLDGSIPVQKIVEHYQETKKTPSTTSTNPEEYQELFSKIRNDHPDATIVHVGYTSRASSSFQHARIAAEEFEDIHLVDALNVSVGLTTVVVYAAQLLEKEPDIPLETLLEKIEKAVPKTRMVFLPGNLDFLRAGGRVSNAAYIGGTLLKIKPLIELIDGKLVSTKKYRGKMLKVAKQMVQDYLAQYPIDREHICLCYSLGLDEDIKAQMEQMVKDEGFQHVQWVEAGGVISSHAGPGAFGVAALEE